MQNYRKIESVYMPLLDQLIHKFAARMDAAVTLSEWGHLERWT